MKVNTAFVALVLILITLALAGWSDMRSSSDISFSPGVSDKCENEYLIEVMDTSDGFISQRHDCNRYNKLCGEYDTEIVCR